MIAERKKERDPHTDRLTGQKTSCVLFDKMNYVCRKDSDGMARMGFTYDFAVDEAVFKAVISDLLDRVPIFRSSIHATFLRLYWQAEDYSIDSIVTVAHTDDLYARQDRFFSQEIPLESTCQLRIALLYCKEKTAICMLWNHMCMDGSAARMLFRDICREYDRRINGLPYGGSFKTGNRDHLSVYSCMEGLDRLKAKLQYGFSAMSGESVFPFSRQKAESDRTVMTSAVVDAGIMRLAREKAKKSGCTVNDLTVAAFTYALCRTPGFTEKERTDIMCIVDLRRHIRHPELLGYTNLYTTFTCFVKGKDRCFEDILTDVSKENTRTKADKYAGLHGLPLLDLAWTSMVYAQAALIVRLLYKNPRLCVSNVGAIEPCDYLLSGNEPSDIFVAGPAKDKPYFLMNIMSLNGRMLISSTLKGTDEDKQKVEAFFREIQDCIRAYALDP